MLGLRVRQWIISSLDRITHVRFASYYCFCTATECRNLAETLSHAMQALSLPWNIRITLQTEITTLSLPSDAHSTPLSSDQLSIIMKAPYLDAVIKETLRLYPPHTTNIHRVVPANGHVLDGYYLPAKIKVGTSAYIVQQNSDVFGSDVQTWRPERWLLAGGTASAIRGMENTLWAFGSGSRDCVGKK